MRMQPDGDRDRGQLLLIAGLGVAVMFVALALVVNSAVFAQTLSTRPGPNGAAAIQYRQEATQGVSGIVSETNAHDYVSAESLTGTVSRSVTDWNNLTGSEYGAHGTLTNASVVATVNGTGIHQTTPRVFTDRNGSADWSLFSNANGVRRFRMNITTTNLTTNPSDALTLNVSYQNHTDRTVKVYKNGSRVVIANNMTKQTAPTSGATTLDFSNASLGTAHAPLLGVLSVGTVTGVNVTHGGNAIGRYVALVNATPNNLYGSSTGDNAGSHYYTADGVSPFALHAVYAVRLNLSYHSPRITYDSTVTVSPSHTLNAGHGSRGRGSVRYGVVPLQNRIVFSYANTPTNLSTIDMLGGVHRFIPNNATVIGPQKHNLAGNGRRDIPYVTQSGDLFLTNRTGQSTRLATNVRASKSLLAVGRWNGSRPSIFYADTQNRIHRLHPGGANVIVSNTSGGVTAIAGIGHVVTRTQRDLVYVANKSHTLHYIAPNGTSRTLYSSSTQVGTNASGIGVGAPADFTGNGIDSVPIIDKSGTIDLINATTKTTLSSISADTAPVRGFNVDRDGQPDLVYLSNETLKYVDNVTTTPTAKTFPTANGTALKANNQTGVA